MIGRMCKVGDGLSRPVLMARETFLRERSPRSCERGSESEAKTLEVDLKWRHDLGELFSQVTYCGGYSGEYPPLTIPNREVKLTLAEGTDPPVGRVGSRRS